MGRPLEGIVSRLLLLKATHDSFLRLAIIPSAGPQARRPQSRRAGWRRPRRGSAPASCQGGAAAPDPDDRAMYGADPVGPISAWPHLAQGCSAAAKKLWTPAFSPHV